MPTASVIYASLTGNNEEVAETIVQQLQRLNVAANQLEMSAVTGSDLLKPDIAVIVPYTYGAGDLPEEGLDLYTDLATLHLPHLIYGVAGSGDVNYGTDFCRAVTTFNQRLRSTQAICGAEPVMIDYRLDDTDKQHLAKFSRQLIQTYEGS